MSRHSSGEKGRSLLGMHLESIFVPMALRPWLFEFPEKLTEDDFDLIEWWMSEDEVTETSLIRAARRLLKPWLDGERRLNYEFCYRILNETTKPAAQLIATTAGRSRPLWLAFDRLKTALADRRAGGG